MIELTRRSRIEIPRVDYEKLSGDRMGETSESIRARVQTARDLQLRRFSSNGSSDIVCNATLSDYHAEARQWSEKTYRRTSTYAADLRPMTRAALQRRGLA